MTSRSLSASSQTAAELARIRFVSENFRELQGWRVVPAGFLVMMLSSVGFDACFLLFRVVPIGSIHPMLGPLLGLELFLGSVSSLLICSWAVGPYYDRRFGQVEPRRTSLGWPGSAFIVVFGTAWLGYLNHWSGLSIDFSALGLAGYFASQRGAWRERRHHGWLAVIFMAASLIPVWTGSFIYWGPQPITFREILVFAFGLGLVAAGLLDHALLVRSLPAPAAEE